MKKGQSIVYKKISLLIVLGLILILVSCKNKQEEIIEKEDNIQVDDETIEKVEKTDEIEEMIKTMTTEEKIGQLMIFGLNSTEVDEHIKKMII